MNIRDLHYLVTLATTGHFKRASEQCCVSQPTLSLQIKKLEAELGVQLIERGNRFIKPTAEGALIVDQAKHILKQIAEIKDMAKQMRDPLSGTVSLAIFPTLSPYLLPKLTQHLREALPNVSLKLFEYTTQECIKKIDSGELDAILIAHPMRAANIEHQFLFQEKFVLACSNTHRFAKETMISAEMIDTRELLLLQEGHCLRDQSLDFCSIVRSQPTFDYSATSLDTLLAMVGLNEGVTLLPSLAIPTINSNLISIKLFEEPVPSRSIYLHWRRSSAKNTIMTTLAELIRQVVGSAQGISLEESQHIQ